MTDKEIITINGVDVSTCGKYHYKGCTAYDFQQCKNIPDCPYKQFHRLQTQYNEVVNQNQDLQQQCEELKGYIKEVLAPHAQMLQKLSDRYKQALEKIEERVSYINTFLVMINNAMIPSYVKTSSYNAQENINKIIDILNEVKDDCNTKLQK